MQNRGGSTITQQYIKNTFLSSEKSYVRKLKELILAVQLEQAFDKKKILELYLNKIAYGNNAFGIEKAAQIYFGKTAKELDVAESAILASIPKGPSYYNPYGPHRYSLLSKQFTPEDLIFRRITGEKDLQEKEFQRGLLGKNVEIAPGAEIYIQGRSDLVLNRMEKVGYIAEEERKAALDKIQKMDFKKYHEKIAAPHFVFYVIDQLEEKYGKEIVAQGGLNVYTTIDPKMQEIAERVVKEGGEANEKNYNAKNAALVAMDPKTGQILAMAGSRYYFDEKIDGNENVALDYRQPGSSFKPFVYSQAFYNRYGPASVVYDTPIQLGAASPKNFDGNFRGPMTIREALGQSRNIPAIKAYYAAGEQKPIIELAQKMGIKFLDPDVDHGWPMAIGSAEVRLFDMVSAFGVFANNGIRHEPVSIVKVTTSKGEVLEEWKEEEGQEVLDPQVAYLITSILSDTSVRLGPNLTIPDQINATKTGTSNRKIGYTYYPHDLWAMGYTTRLVAGVWTGNNDDRKDGNISGAADGYNVAAPIWKKFMTEALKDTPSESFPVPEGIKEVAVSTASGKLPGPSTPPDQIKSDIFASFAIPTEVDDGFIQVNIDTRTNELATEFCPKELVKTMNYRKIIDMYDRDDWLASAEGWVKEHMPAEDLKFTNVVFGTPPVAKCSLHTGENINKKPTITITSPQSGETIAAGTKLSIKIQTDAPLSAVKVEYYLDDEFKFRTVTAPFYGEIRLPFGEKSGKNHTIMARVYDGVGYTGEAVIGITIGEKAPDIPPNN